MTSFTAEDKKVKFAPDQTIAEGIYPEHLVYLKSASICGQADRVEIVGDRIDIHDYKTIIFDCDGVILNSNKIKSEAFRIVASQYGDKEARKLVTYNKENGGVSRYVKFNYFINEIITTKNKLNQILANHTGQPIKKIAEDTDRDNFMSASDAVKYGMVDQVISNRDEVK